MNPDLEAILKAYDAARNTPGEEGKRLIAIYESRLEDILLRHPELSKARLEAMVQVAYRRWIKGQVKPTALPPKA